MGDNDFERFLDENQKEGQDLNCQYRLILEAISDRADTVNNMFNTTTEFLKSISLSESKTNLQFKPVTISNAEAFLSYLTEQAKVTIDQSDYLIGQMLKNFINEEDEEEDEEEENEINDSDSK
jgi:hypothetical protein